jgi:hypothetical protein
MTELSVAQRVILAKASQRDDRIAIPLPDHLKGGAAKKVVASLLAKGLVEELEVRPGQPVWRAGKEGGSMTLRVTEAGLTALGPAPAPSPTKTKRAVTADKTKPRGPKRPEPRKLRTDTKQAQLISMLKRAKGATIDEIVEALDWQPHTVRGAIAGALKKKLGLKVASENVERRGRVYRIA